MDRSMQSRDHILGHAPRDPFASSGAPPRKAAVDYSDVFGGPPRRLSAISDAAGGACALGGERGGGVEEDGERSWRWSASVAEKPVFGGVGVGSPAHQRHLGDDFFSDIFRGNESACPTPRRRGRDPLSPSTPGSRVLSPTRPLPPTSGVSSLPVHLRYSSRLAKSFDNSTFRFPTAFTACQHEESIPDVLGFPASTSACAPAILRQNSLSHGVPQGSMPLGTATSASDGTDEADGQLKNASAGSKAYSGSGHFHFSIYKWASKGATLFMPSNFKERTKRGSRLGAVSSQVWHRADLPLDSETTPQGILSFQNQSEAEDKSTFSDLASAKDDHTGSSNEVAESLPAASDTKSVLCDITDTSGSSIRDNPGFPVAEGKPELKNLRHLTSEDSDGKGNGGTTGQAKKEQGLVRDCQPVTKDGDDTAKTKQEKIKDTALGCTEKASQERHGASEILGDKALPTRARGRVMEFIKIFNQKATQKTSGPVESQPLRPTGEGRPGDHAGARIANADEGRNANCGEASSAPITAGQGLKEEEHKTSIKGSGVEKMDRSLPEISGTSVSLSGSALDSLDASFCNMEEDHFENIEECLVEELSRDQNEVTEIDLHHEETEMKMSDTKIQEWSKGKEGNIRSLLSTLQYVLWPGSGWKSVPLVDIIEGASVRRAYQRALLCLHPDKLQQRGAAEHQKYIAEKVFDILQEAWDYFNSLSSL